jgi:energy-coupling factor transporter ATP-binding protein EcfA2
VIQLQGQLAVERRRVTDLSNELSEVRVNNTNPSPGPTPVSDDGGKPAAEEQSPTASGNLVAAVTVVGLLLAYAAICGVFLYVRPLWILTLHSRLLPDKVVEAADSSVFAKLAKLLLGLVGIDYFATHRRTRQAWLAYYQDTKESTFADLQTSIRADFLKHDDALDTWVAKRRDKALVALEQTLRLAQKSAFIPLPIRQEGASSGPIVAPQSRAFGYLFEGEAASLVEIVGPGGVGKSTFAAQLARWSLLPRPEDRLTPHLMIPVFVQELAIDKMANINGAISRYLREMVGGEDLEDDIVRKLLLKKRVLVILDGLSELDAETQSAVKALFQVADVNALVITTRQVQQLGPKRLTVLRPEMITEQNLFYFVSEYLGREEVREVLSGGEARLVSESVMEVFGPGKGWRAVTPLVVKLIVDEAVELRRRRRPLSELSGSAPGAIINYLLRVNPQDDNTPNRVPNDVIINASRVLANCGLRPRWAPRDFFLDEAQKELVEFSQSSGRADIIRRLIDNSVLEERTYGGTSFLRFSFDPVAEYLAALYWLNRLRGNEDGWKTWLKELKETPGFPDEMQGFLGALEDCMVSYRTQFLVPEIEFPWSAEAVTPART